MPLYKEEYHRYMSKESIIKAFEGVNVRIAWDDELEDYFFSVNDIVEVLTESKDVKQYIKRMRSRDPELDSRWGTICTPTRMRAADGKYYRTQAATMNGILRIVQSIPSKKAEPLKQWLADASCHSEGSKNLPNPQFWVTGYHVLNSLMLRDLTSRAIA